MDEITYEEFAAAWQRTERERNALVEQGEALGFLVESDEHGHFLERPAKVIGQPLRIEPLRLTPNADGMFGPVVR